MRRPLAWLLLSLAAFAGLSGWWLLGRPVALADAPSQRIACVSYAPFRGAGESPMAPGAHVSRRRIEHDLALLSARFDCVRTYSQGLGLDAVPAIAKQHGMKVLLGIWLSADRTANAREVRLGIATANRYRGTVRAIVVGNEVLLRGELPPHELAAYLRRVHAATGLPVTYADVWSFWLRYARVDGLADAVSFVTVHILPYWDDAPMASSQAVDWVARTYARVRRAFPDRRVMIGETGWPSAGRPRGPARASRVDEARFVRGFLRYAAGHDVPYNLIESFDQPWKRIQEGTVGGYWGLYDARARPKFALRGPVVEVPRWWLGWYAAALGAALAVLLARIGRRRGHPLAAILAGLALGATLALQVRQDLQACATPGAWATAALGVAAAAIVGLALIREIAAVLGGVTAAAPRGVRRCGVVAPSGCVRFLCWAALAWVDLLLVFDGRYRDYPLTLFAVPAVGFLVRDVLCGPRPTPASIEERILAAWLLAAPVIGLFQDGGDSRAAVSWLGVGVLCVLPWAVLQARQAQHAHQ